MSGEPGAGWRMTLGMGWTCVACDSFIPAGEPFHDSATPVHAVSRTRPVCLSCILTASAALLPGQPKSIRVEMLMGQRSPEDRSHEYRLTVDGVEYGVMTVDAGIAEDQQVPALLALVRQALKWRVEGSGRVIADERGQSRGQDSVDREIAAQDRADETSRHYMEWIRSQGGEPSRSIFAAFKAGRESA
jgi:hypothetical protein